MLSLKVSTGPVAKRARFGDASIISIYVGPEERYFPVHESFICEISDFFRAGSQGGSLETQERVMRLPEDRPEIFELFLEWVYGRRFQLAVEGEHRITEDSFCNGFNLYTFAEKYGVPSLQRSVVNAFFTAFTTSKTPFRMGISMSRTLLPLKCSIRKVYGAPITIRPLRKMIVAFLVWKVRIGSLTSHASFQEVMGELPEFMVDYLEAIGERYNTTKTCRDPFEQGVEYFYQDGSKDTEGKGTKKYGDGPLDNPTHP